MLKKPRASAIMLSQPTDLRYFDICLRLGSFQKYEPNYAFHFFALIVYAGGAMSWISTNHNNIDNQIKDFLLENNGSKRELLK